MALRRLVGGTALAFASATTFRSSSTTRSHCLASGNNGRVPAAKERLSSTSKYYSGRPKGIDASICHSQDLATKGFIMQQTMLRIKDPKKSLDFYTRILGMRVLQELHFDEWKFSIYFVGYCRDADIPIDPVKRTQWAFKQPGTVELTHNWGTEDDPEVKYHSGNEDPRGFGHIGITVPDVREACARFEKEGVSFRKKPDGGNMKGLAFIYDPDGYSIEVLSADQMARDFSKFAPGKVTES